MSYPRYRAGAYGSMNEADDGQYVDIRDIADDLQEVLRVFYATAKLTEDSVGAAENLNALVDEDRPPAPEIFPGTLDALDSLCNIRSND